MTWIENTVAIIGGGPGGLVSCKEALQAGLKPTIFEAADDIGGNWRVKDGKIWPGMRINTSRYCITSFSDYSWNDNTPAFPYGSQVNEYLHSYAAHFGVTPCTKLNTWVKSVRQQGGKWQVTYVQARSPADVEAGDSEGGDKADAGDAQAVGGKAAGVQKALRPERDCTEGVEVEEEFDFVIVATGALADPRGTQLPGASNFGGLLLHSSDYAGTDPLFAALEKVRPAGRKVQVVVVGNAPSASNICAEIGNACGDGYKVINVVRSGKFLLKKYMKNPVTGKAEPLDMLCLTRAPRLPLKNLPWGPYFQAFCGMLEGVLGNPGSIHPALVKDDMDIVSISQDCHYIQALRNNKIEVFRGSVKCLSKSQVILDDGTALDADAVVLATGFYAKLSFLDESTKAAIEYQPHTSQPLIAYHTITPPSLPSLAFIGFNIPQFLRTMELQARFAAALFSNKLSLPSPEDMEANIERQRALRSFMIGKVEGGTAPYFGSFYEDELAAELGILRAVEEWVVDDPWYNEVIVGKNLPALYRLSGPGADVAHAKKEIEQYRRAQESGEFDEEASRLGVVGEDDDVVCRVDDNVRVQVQG